ncbi:MAG TPA: hypothetical protein VG966_12695 [Hyphomicrobiaceae bacterium]|nr:hypothetical protein [Hyphomicrobiaceae bacterium]
MADTAVQHHDAHEQRDVSHRGLLILGAAFALFVLVALGGPWVLFGTHEGNFAAAQHLGQLPNDTELEQRDQLARYMAAQTAELERLGWTDATKQFAKVSIEDAMQLLAAKRAAR